MKAIMLRVVEASVAATGPTGVAFQIHHMVIAFHNTKVSAAHPNIRHQLRRPPSYEELIHSRGTKPMSCVKPVMPSHPGDSRSAERRAAANLRYMETGVNFFRCAKVVKPRKISKIFPYICDK